MTYLGPLGKLVKGLGNVFDLHVLAVKGPDSQQRLKFKYGL